MNKLLFILALLTLSSCNPCKRIQKKILKHPECVKMDSITIIDTLTTETIKSDTVVNIFDLTDTLYLTKDKLKIKAIWLHDSIYISGECTGDTIIKFRKQRIRTIINTKQKKTLIQKIEDWFIWIAVILIAIRLFKREKSNK